MALSWVTEGGSCNEIFDARADLLFSLYIVIGIVNVIAITLLKKKKKKLSGLTCNQLEGEV